MNTIKILILALVITFSSQVSANTDNPESDLKLVSQQIETLLKHSEIPINSNKVITIKFKVNRNNKIILVSSNSDSYDISEFIKTRLSLKDLSIDKTSNYRFYSIPVKFLSTVD